jgi:hypothetical protein
MAGAQATPVFYQPGHTIFYLASEDTVADRHNIALLARIAARSTTPLNVEIFYDRPLKLGNWAEATGSLRYRRLRSTADFVLAERIAGANTECVLFFNFLVFAHSEDLWRLLGHVQREPFTLLLPGKILPQRGMNAWRTALLAARLDLLHYADSPNRPAILALNRRLLHKSTQQPEKGLLRRKFYADILSGQSLIQPLRLHGRSRVVAMPDAQWLTTGKNTVRAWRTWRSHRRFPWWFTYRHPLFVVSQLSFYIALLVLLATFRGSVILFLFAIGLTLPYFCRGFLHGVRTWFRNVRRLAALLPLMGARLVLYLIG